MLQLDDFADAPTRAAIELDAFLVKYKPLTPMGRRAKESLRAFDAAAALAAELSRIRRARDASRAEPARWSALRRALAELPSVEPSTRVTTRADLFTLKRAVQTVHVARRQLEHLGLDDDAIGAKSPALEPLDRCVDPEGTGRRTFELDAAQHPRLATIRRAIDAQLQQLAAQEAAHQQLVAARVGLARIPSDGVVVDLENDALCQRLGSESSFRLLDRTAHQATYRLIPSSEAHETRKTLTSLYAEERAEEDRVLTQLCADVNARSSEIAIVHDWLAAVDCLVAKVELANDPECCIPEVAAADTLPQILGGRNPAVADAVQARGGDYRALDLQCVQRLAVVVGSNMSGKSCLLRTLGLLQVAFQLGLPVPAEAFRSCVFSKVFLSSPAIAGVQYLSSFANEMTRLTAALRSRHARALFLLDEPASGTSVTAATALCHAVLDALGKSNSVAVVATHFEELADRDDVDSLTMGGVDVRRLDRLDPRADGWIGADFDLFDRKIYRGRDRARLARDALTVAELCGLETDIVGPAQAYIERQPGRNP